MRATGALASLLRAALATLALVVGGPASAGASSPVVLDRGHIDLVAVRVGASGLEVGLSDDATSPGAAVWRTPGEVVLRVPTAARTSVPAGGAFAFLGPPGAQVWVLPQVQRPDLLWAGWSTAGVPAGVLAGDTVSWRLAHVDGPGAFSLFTTDQSGSPHVIFDSADGAPDELAVPVGSHAHGNLVFGAEGSYRLVFEVSATTVAGVPLTSAATYTSEVGDEPAAAPPPPPPQGAATPGPPQPLPVPDAAPAPPGPVGPGQPAAPGPVAPAEAAAEVPAVPEPPATTVLAAPSVPRGPGATDPLASAEWRSGGTGGQDEVADGDEVDPRPGTTARLVSADAGSGRGAPGGRPWALPLVLVGAGAAAAGCLAWRRRRGPSMRGNGPPAT